MTANDRKHSASVLIAQQMKAIKSELKDGGEAQWKMLGQIGKGAFGVVYKVGSHRWSVGGKWSLASRRDSLEGIVGELRIGELRIGELRIGELRMVSDLGVLTSVSVMTCVLIVLRESGTAWKSLSKG